MANLYANVCHVSRPADLAGCLDMITGSAAKLMRLEDYGIKVGGPADLVCVDASNPADAGRDARAAAVGVSNAARASFTPASSANTSAALRAVLMNQNRSNFFYFNAFFFTRTGIHFA